MLTLAVAHETETFDRIEGPLAERDVAVEHVSLTERTTVLSAPSIDPDAIDAGFVFPGRLMEGGVLDALLQVPWINDRHDVIRSRNKAETLAVLDRAGLPVPETVMVSNPVDESAVLDAYEHLDPPVVLKPNSTTRGTGVLKADDFDSLMGAIDYLDLIHDFPVTRDRSYLLQEYLPDARDLRLMVLDGEYAGAVERALPEAARETGRWKHNVHRGAEARGVDPSPEIRSLAEEAADVMDISLLGVDVLTNGDRTVVTETNARPTVDSEEKYVADFYDRLATLIRETANSGSISGLS